jgi:hypothetical protein
MNAREVTHVARDEDGTITAIGNPGESWSPRSKEDAVRDIDGHQFKYYVKPGPMEVKIDVVHPSGRYLRTEPDESEIDNLESLPDLEKDSVGFQVTSGKLVISDPCYPRGTWCAGVVERVKNGTWHATVSMTPEGRALTALCEGEEYVGTMKKRHFEVGVDSAQLGIFCDSLFPSRKNTNPEFREACRDAYTENLRAGVVLGRGVVCFTDDGSYTAFVGRNKDRLAVAVRIEFS